MGVEPSLLPAHIEKMRHISAKFTILLLFVTSLTLSACGDDQSSDGDSNTDGADTGITADAGGTDTAGDASSPDVGSTDTGGSDGTGGGSSGRTGLEGYCDHYVDCGGTYYADADACIDASIDYWGECRRDELDTFGDCMMDLSCDEWGNPDAYNPANTPCADEWSAVGDATCE